MEHPGASAHRLPAADGVGGVVGLAQRLAVELEHGVAAEHQRPGRYARPGRRTAAHFSSASCRASSAGATPVTCDSSTPDTITTGSMPALRSVASRAGEAEARTSVVTVATLLVRAWPAGRCFHQGMSTSLPLPTGCSAVGRGGSSAYRGMTGAGSGLPGIAQMQRTGSPFRLTVHRRRMRVSTNRGAGECFRAWIRSGTWPSREASSPAPRRATATTTTRRWLARSGSRSGSGSAVAVTRSPTSGQGSMRKIVTESCRRRYCAPWDPMWHSATFRAWSTGGIPTWDLDLSRVHVTRLDGGAGRIEGDVVHHEGVSLDHEVVERDGHRVLIPERCVLEAGSRAKLPASRLVIADGLLRQKLSTPDQLEDQFRLMERWPFMRSMHLPVRMADGAVRVCR